MGKPKYNSVDGYGVNHREGLVYQNGSGHTIVGDGLEVNPNGDVTVGKDLYVEDEIVVDSSEKIVNTDGDFVFDDLVWTNQDPTNAFESGKINLDLSSIKSVVIDFKVHSADDNYATVKVVDKIKYTVNSSLSNGSNYIVKRIFEVTNTGINFGNGYAATLENNNGYHVDNTSCIPYKIYVTR